MVLKSSRHNVSTGNTVRSKWANNKHDFHPVIRKSVLGDGTSEGDMFDISDGYIRCSDGCFLDDGCLETGPSIQATLLYSLNKRGRWKIPTLLARRPTHPMDRPMGNYFVLLVGLSMFYQFMQNHAFLLSQLN